MPTVKFPVTMNTLYWADMYLYQAEAWLHNAKYDRNKEHAILIADMWKNKCIKILEEGWKLDPYFVYADEGMKPHYKPDLNHFGKHEFPIHRHSKTSHKRRVKELKPQPQCKCKHFTYDHSKGKCTKCDCSCFTI